MEFNKKLEVGLTYIKLEDVDKLKLDVMLNKLKNESDLKEVFNEVSFNSSLEEVIEKFNEVGINVGIKDLDFDDSQLREISCSNDYDDDNEDDELNSLGVPTSGVKNSNLSSELIKEDRVVSS